MKKLTLTLAFATLISNAAFSDGVESELMEAPSDYIISQLSVCKNYAIEDEIPEPDLVKYLLTCINDELEESDYKLINVLPKEE